MKRYLFSILTAFVLIVLSLMPVPEVKELEDVPLFDKWVHFLMYGTLSLVVWVEYLRSHAEVEGIKATMGAVVAPIVMSGLLELAQAYLTTCRSGEWLDFLANSIGVGIASSGVSVYLFCRRRTR